MYILVTFPSTCSPLHQLKLILQGGKGGQTMNINEVGNFYSYFKKEFFDSPIYEYNRVIHFLKL